MKMFPRTQISVVWLGSVRHVAICLAAMKSLWYWFSPSFQVFFPWREIQLFALSGEEWATLEHLPLLSQTGYSCFTFAHVPHRKEGGEKQGSLPASSGGPGWDSLAIWTVSFTLSIWKAVKLKQCSRDLPPQASSYFDPMRFQPGTPLRLAVDMAQ